MYIYTVYTHHMYIYTSHTHIYIYTYIFQVVHIYIPLYSFLGYAIHVQITQSSIPGVSSRLSKGMGSSEHDGWPQDPGSGNPWWHGVIAGASTINPWKSSRSRWTPEKIYLYLKRKIIWTWTSMILGTKAVNVPGCKTSIWWKMWISSDRKWLGTFLLSIFPCHEMDVFFLVLPFCNSAGSALGRQRWYLSVVKAETYLCWLAWSMVHGIHDCIFSFRMVNGMVESGKIPKKPQQDYIRRRKDVVNHPSLNFFGLACASGCFFFGSCREHFQGCNQPRKSTLPETNSSPLKIGVPKRKLVFQLFIFRCYVSFREGTPR